MPWGGLITSYWKFRLNFSGLSERKNILKKKHILDICHITSNGYIAFDILWGVLKHLNISSFHAIMGSLPIFSKLNYVLNCVILKQRSSLLKVNQILISREWEKLLTAFKMTFFSLCFKNMTIKAQMKDQIIFIIFKRIDLEEVKELPLFKASSLSILLSFWEFGNKERWDKFRRDFPYPY